MTLFLIALLIGAPFVAGALIDQRWSDSVIVAMVFACAWSGTVTPLHHEVAHAVVARHFGIEVLSSGYRFGGAYVVLRSPSTGTSLRAWIWTLSAGATSNAVVGGALLAGWELLGRAWFTSGGMFCMLVAAVELCTAFANIAPGPKTDGGVIAEVLRKARSPLVI